MTTIFIQGEVSGYCGPSVNLLGALDTDTGLFIISKELETGKRIEGAMVVSNDPRSDRRDSLFTEEKLQDAIHAHFRAVANHLLELKTSVSKHDPSHRIQVQGVNESGTRHQLAPDITNGNIAVLAMLGVSNIVYTTETTNSFASELAEMFATI